MKLVSFQIKNVKSIEQSGLCYLSDLDSVTVFAGQNEAGKSAVLEALNFFRNGADERFVKLSKRLQAHPCVICTFKLEEKDYNSDNSYINELLKKLETVSCYRGNEDNDDFEEIKFDKDTEEKINNMALELSGENKKGSSEPKEKETSEDDAKVEEVVDLAVNLPNEVKTFILSKLPEFIFYDSFTGLLPGEIKVSDIPNNQAVLDFQKIFSVDFLEAVGKNPQERTSIINYVKKNAEMDLNTYWTQKRTTEEDDKYFFEINLIPSSGDDARVEFLIHRDDVPLFMEQKSKGFQWFNAFNLRLKAIGVEKDASKSYILLIDEPGQGLHETAQRDVKAVLEELSEKGMQIIYTTHNPSLIGVNDGELLRIRLVFQDKNSGTKINNITQFASGSKKQNKDALSPIITAMGISHLGQLIDATKKCVVLEGITDHYYLNAFKIVLNIGEEYALIPACGVKNIRPLISILLGWGSNFKAIFDDGKEGKSTYKDLGKYLFANDDDGLTKVVKKLVDFDGIEDLFTREDFYKHILKEKMDSSSTKNSEIAKSRKKELLARLFLEDAKSEKIKENDLSDETKNNFKQIFDWLKR